MQTIKNSTHDNKTNSDETWKRFSFICDKCNEIYNVRECTFLRYLHLSLTRCWGSVFVSHSRVSLALGIITKISTLYWYATNVSTGRALLRIRVSLVSRLEPRGKSTANREIEMFGRVRIISSSLKVVDDGQMCRWCYVPSFLFVIYFLSHNQSHHGSSLNCRRFLTRKRQRVLIFQKSSVMLQVQKSQVKGTKILKHKNNDLKWRDDQK